VCLTLLLLLLLLHTLNVKILSCSWRELGCCSSCFQDTWKWGKISIKIVSRMCQQQASRKKHLVLGCNHILMPKSNRCGPKIHESSSTSTQYTTKRLFLKLGSWQKSQATRGENGRERERERERDTHTHTHTLTTYDNTMQWHCNSLLESWKSFNYNFLLAARGRRTTFFLVILLFMVCCQLDPFEDGNEISPRRSALCFNLAANLSFHILASCTY
jgi:hypothetical protein